MPTGGAAAAAHDPAVEAATVGSAEASGDGLLQNATSLSNAQVHNPTLLFFSVTSLDQRSIL